MTVLLALAYVCMGPAGFLWAGALALGSSLLATLIGRLWMVVRIGQLDRDATQMLVMLVIPFVFERGRIVRHWQAMRGPFSAFFGSGFLLGFSLLAMNFLGESAWQASRTVHPTPVVPPASEGWKPGESQGGRSLVDPPLSVDAYEVAADLEICVHANEFAPRLPSRYVAFSRAARASRSGTCPPVSRPARRCD